MVTNTDDKQVSVDEGKDAFLVCITIGNPEQSITWYTEDGDEIVDGDRKTISEVILGSGEVNGTTKQSTLGIVGVLPLEDYGDYRCKASNIVGFSEHIIALSGLGE